ncbi:hypothetical protein CERSUDRAFT_94435 [Gelatoporia subvermispora B]|uniref:Uncharacterized protein n=1 Tax=Ceriporiopsis subvermispora (strain B) TaxID=914234 RepID=M2QKA6_CERS8|nr:hypothetical protein CERSUDRAFT_94435 [Gelatoporia subvermispora B]
MPGRPRLPFKTRPLVHTQLPPEKLRALVSLYHQCDTFITPETLSDAIDDAFVYAKQRQRWGLYRELSSDQTAVVLRKMQEGDPTPIRPEWRVDSEGKVQSTRSNEGSTMSKEQSTRSKRVEDALYGLAGDDHSGLELLETEKKRIMEYVREDVAESRGSSRR